jgi:uncharacterized protein
MKHSRHLINLAGLWIVLSVLSACSTILKPIPDKSKYFLLTPIAQSDASSSASQNNGGFTLGLGPITFPAYLDRSEVVTRVEPNQLKVSENDHWAEPLKTNFTRILSQNLSALLGGTEIVNFPWYSSSHLDYQIAIDVERFESDAQGNAVLLAQWSVEDPTTKKVLDRGDANLTAPSGGGEEPAAAALSQTLSNFSRQIATAIRQVNAQQHR